MWPLPALLSYAGEKDDANKSIGWTATSNLLVGGRAAKGFQEEFGSIEVDVG